MRNRELLARFRRSGRPWRTRVCVGRSPASHCAAQRLKEERNLAVITPMQVTGYPSPLEAGIADFVCALDMFHMVRDRLGLLAEFSRLLDDEGRRVIDRGHMSEKELRQELARSGLWRVEGTAGAALICVPTRQQGN
ncbi:MULTISPECIES: methyltransferase domain-containing protein [unclassified Mesorhizobium]|uniref:methyltransferase domain-containing protein n=1 Tax=unclassified Mesorhizobium TaxID=325217 RepID=UPI003339E4AC